MGKISIERKEGEKQRFDLSDVRVYRVQRRKEERE